jgi:hypothetical protein
MAMTHDIGAPGGPASPDLAEHWSAFKRTLNSWATRVDTFGRNAADADEWRQMRALEATVLEGAIVTQADAVAKLEATALFFERAGVDDSPQFEAILQVVQWLGIPPRGIG